MTSEQAKEILTLYRPGTADAHDSAFAEAVELARKERELESWFEIHCANHEMIRNRFKQIAVPAGLKEQIVAERKFKPGIVALPRPRWPQPAFAVAAMIVFLFSLLWFSSQSRAKNNYSQYRSRMVSTALRAYGMDLETNDLNQIRGFLARKNAPSHYALPDGLGKLESTGCVVLRWHNKPVSMICFRTGRPLPPGEKSDLFLFVTDRVSFSNVLPVASPALKRVNKLVTASWVEGDKFYLLATSGGEEFIKKFL